MFTATGVDNFGAGTITMEGVWDDKTRSITLKGTAVDPMSGKDIMVRKVMKFIDYDTQQIEMYDTKNGTETKAMETKLNGKSNKLH